MEKGVDCGIIRDLLPLYEDGAASEESQALVRAHLKDCPECREELRKMRVPISLPPDEDEEAVKHYLARQAELRRKENRRLALIGVPLAVILVFCLCYTLLPRSWSGVGGKAEPDQIMGSYVMFSFHNGSPAIDVWQLDREHERAPSLTHEIMDALRGGSYRAELRNLANYTPLAPLFQDTGVHDGLGGSINLFLVKDNEVAVTVMLFDTPDHEVHIAATGDGNTYFYHTGGEVYDSIAALMREYGEFQP